MTESTQATKECYDSPEDWRAEATRLFGDDPMKWKFVCPSCKSVMSLQDYKDAGAPSSVVAFSCVGRWTGSKRTILSKGEGPCNYAGGGLFGLNPVVVGDTQVFEFARGETGADDD